MWVQWCGVQCQCVCRNVSDPNSFTYWYKSGLHYIINVKHNSPNQLIFPVVSRPNEQDSQFLGHCSLDLYYTYQTWKHQAITAKLLQIFLVQHIDCVDCIEALVCVYYRRVTVQWRTVLDPAVTTVWPGTASHTVYTPDVTRHVTFSLSTHHTVRMCSCGHWLRPVCSLLETQCLPPNLHTNYRYLEPRSCSYNHVTERGAHISTKYYITHNILLFK